MKIFRTVCLAALLSLALILPGNANAASPIKVAISTNMGLIVVELNQEKAPKTVSNFLFYVKSGFYEGTIFHRVIRNFMIQGGGMTPDLKDKPNKRKPIQNEAYNGLRNRIYTIAMARTNDPHSATSQFFINVTNNDFLDYQNSSTSGFGYCVFGEVVQGKEVVDRIKNVPTTSVGMYQDVPRTPVVIEKVAILP